MGGSSSWLLTDSFSWYTNEQAFISDLHLRGQRWVPILDPVIHISEGYSAYDEGNKKDVWIKDITGRPYVGQVTLSFEVVLFL
jgi:alpha-glucosidase (family GH31 glycosyl hydrolase)